MKTFLFDGQAYTIAKYVQCFQPTATIEDAVKHPLWNQEEQVGLISRHRERMLKKEADRHPAAGLFMEKTK